MLEGHRALISDIHGNLDALQAVLEDIDRIGVKEIWCLGDVVGYGPEPVECFRLAEERCDIIVMGNHEQALLPGGGERFNSRAKRAIDWTRDTLLAAEGGAAMIDRIQKWPKGFTREQLLFVHGSPRDPTEEYLMPKDALRTDKMPPQFDAMEWVAFCGHTHFPGVFEPNTRFVKPEDMIANVYMLDYDVKAIINVGSVGQPRDRNPDACYVTFDGDSVVYRRVKYDVQSTRRKILAIPELDSFLSDRLLEGR